LTTSRLCLTIIPHMKTVFMVLTILVLTIMLWPAACSCPTVEAVPEDNSEWAVVLANRFSPVILLKNDEEPGEKYEPVPVQAMIDQSHILSVDNPSFMREASIAGMMQYSESSYYLDIPELSPASFLESLFGYKQRYDQAIASGLSPTVYARVLKPGGTGHTVIQYWLFYYFDEWSNLHEGDWELVELVFPDLSAQELMETGVEPEFAAYSQHQAGQKLSWDEMREKGLIAGTHPLVYVARGSHANYFTPGQYWLITDFDDTGLSNWREISPEVIMISEKDPENDKNQWVDFRGCWGEHLDFAFSWGPLIWTQCGPNGPAWGSKGEKNSRWLNPYQWAEKTAEYPQAYFFSFLPEFARKWPDLSIFSLFSPGDIHVYDKYGNHAGLNEQGEFETQIPGAEYIAPEGAHSKTIIIPDGDVSDGYTMIVVGNDYGDIDIKTQIPDSHNNVKRYLEYRDVPVTPTTVARLQFTYTPFVAPPENSINVRDSFTVLEIDKDNDGYFESRVKPGTSKIVPGEREAEKTHLTLLVEGRGTARAVTGYTYEKNGKAAIIAEPEEGWVFDQWGGDVSGTFASLNIVMDRDKTIIAYFKPEKIWFDLNIAVEGEGITSPEPGTYTFAEGTRLTIQAMPAEGHEFAGWSGDYGDSPFLELTMDRDIHVIAIFRPKEPEPFIDQVNDPPDPSWSGGINILPETGTGQSFVTQYPVLVAVEVNIYTLAGPPVEDSDIITMRVLYKGKELLTAVSQFVEKGFNGWLRFEMPEGGIYVGEGADLLIMIEGTEANVFGWKRDGNTYPAGTAWSHDEASQNADFLFRTYGTFAE